MNTSNQEWKTLLLKVISLGTNCSNVSLETLWEFLSSELNCGLFGSGKKKQFSR